MSPAPPLGRSGPEADKREGWGELRRMSVAKSARRRGVAKQLHQALIAHAQAQQLKGVFLSTSSLQVVCAPASTRRVEGA